MEVRNDAFHKECQVPRVFFSFAMKAAVDDFQKEIGFFASQQDRNLSWQEPADLRRDENREPFVLRGDLLKVASYSPARSVFFLYNEVARHKMHQPYVLIFVQHEIHLSRLYVYNRSFPGPVTLFQPVCHLSVRTGMRSALFIVGCS